MIYEAVSENDPLRQGDIFQNIPFMRFNLERIPVLLNTGNIAKLQWNDVSQKEVEILASLEKVDGIILTQDCDCLRNPTISFMRIIPWNKNCQSDKNWMNAIIEMNTKGITDFYLPIDSRYMMIKKMIIEFASIFNLDRENLLNLRYLRKCRLNNEALEHFRWKISHYFRRYSYDEYYPLTKSEMDEYEIKNVDSGDIFIRRPYQKI